MNARGKIPTHAINPNSMTQMLRSSYLPTPAQIIAKMRCSYARTQQHYALLFQNNIDTEKGAERILGRPLTPIMPFFQNEFSNAAD